jgi:carbon storage regulator CsrA
MTDAKAGIFTEVEIMDGWLVLTRKLNQDILIGDHIVVRIAEIRGQQVRLAIRAPDDVTVLRREVACARRRDQEHIGGDW